MPTRLQSFDRPKFEYRIVRSNVVCLPVCLLLVFSFFVLNKSGNNSQNLFQNSATSFEKRVLPTVSLIIYHTIILIFIIQLLKALYQPMPYSWDVTRTPQRCHLAISRFSCKERAKEIGSTVRKCSENGTWSGVDLVCAGIRFTNTYYWRVLLPCTTDDLGRRISLRSSIVFLRLAAIVDCNS